MNNDSSITVFIIEDDVIFMNMISEYISSKFAKVKIHKFITGEEALDNLDREPNVVVLDYFLDGASKGAMNGLEVLNKIRKEDASIRVIIISCQESPEISANVMRHGAYEYIIKNNNAPEALEKALDHLTGHLILDQKLILKKLVWVLVGAVVIAALLVVSFMI